jgi:hypothetical protein
MTDAPFDALARSVSIAAPMKGTLTHDRYGAGALGVYFALSMLFFGRGLVGHFTTRHVGKAIGDPALIAWFLQWLAHAVLHRINPFYTDLVWAPASLNMAWTTWMPLIGLLLMPITRTLGPVASLNVLYLLALPLGSWSAFVLYRYLTGSWWASLVGGYLFGFSGYMLYRLWEGDPQLLLVFPVVLSLWLVLRALRAEIRPPVFVCALAAMLLVEFLISLEIFATATMFAAIAFVLACGLFDGGDTRKRLRALIVPIIASYAIALAAVAPYLYFFFAIAAPQAPMWQPFVFSADLSFFVLPSWVSELGRLGFVARAFDRMPDTVNYVGFSYLGPMMLAIVAVFTWQHWREARTRLLLWTMLIAAVLSCGPWLTVGGRRLMWMPGALLSAIPLMRDALPLWFTMYLMLAAALVVAIWLASSDASTAAKSTVALAAVLFAMPRLSSAFWVTPVDTPAFFLSGTYRNYLQHGEIVLPVPYGWRGNSLMWQAQTDMYFRMAGAWTGPPPAEFERWPAMVALFNGVYLPDPELQLKAFLAAHQVTAVLVDESIKDSPDPRQREQYRTVLAALGPAPTEAGGVLIYRFTAAAFAPWRDFNPIDLERRVDLARFAELLNAVDRYLQGGAEPALLSPERLERMGLIRDDWLGGPNIRISNGLWARSHRDGTFEVGTFGSCGALAGLNARYRPEALRVRTAPIAMAENPGGEEELELMVMTFDRGGLTRAAGLAHAVANPGSAPAAAAGGGTTSTVR